MSKTLSIRLPDDVADWLENEANQRGRTKTDLIVSLVKVAMDGLYDDVLHAQDDCDVQGMIDASLAPVLERLARLEGGVSAVGNPGDRSGMEQLLKDVRNKKVGVGTALDRICSEFETSEGV